MNEIQTMLKQAQNAQQYSYAPYSKFHVGACIKTTDGQYFTGANIENASYSLACCAEATAIAHMMMAGHKEIAEILVTSSSDEIVTPCGACRQRIVEFAHPDAKVHCCNQLGQHQTYSLNELLPHSFTSRFLDL